MEVNELSVSPVYNNSEENVQVGYLSQSIVWFYDLCEPSHWLWIYESLTLYWREVFPSITLFNVLVYTLKYVTPGIYTYNFLKEYYMKSREKLKRRWKEIEELKPQAEELNQNFKILNREHENYKEALHVEIDTIQGIRERVHEFPEMKAFAGDYFSASRDLDGELIIYDLLKDINSKNYNINIKNTENVTTFAEDVHADDAAGLVRNSASESDMNKDCQVKIIKVTNIYKVAYLKNYIKQKRMRRANKQSEFNKKMDNVKNMLDEWQKMLSIIDLRNKVIYDLESNAIDTLSQKAVADHLDVRHTDSQMDIRPSTSDPLILDYEGGWFNESDRYVSDNGNNEMQECLSNKYQHMTLEAVTEETTSEIALVENVSKEERLGDDLIDL